MPAGVHAPDRVYTLRNTKRVQIGAKAKPRCAPCPLASLGRLPLNSTGICARDAVRHLWTAPCETKSGARRPLMLYAASASMAGIQAVRYLLPLFRNTVIVLAEGLVNTMSSLPSRLKSPVATPFAKELRLKRDEVGPKKGNSDGP